MKILPSKFCTSSSAKPGGPRLSKIKGRIRRTSIISGRILNNVTKSCYLLCWNWNMATLHHEPVILNIYDLWCANHCSFCSRLGFGVYHTGIEVYGTEYGYAYYPNSKHPSDASGIFEISPRGFEIFGENIKYKKSIEMGHTRLSKDEVHQALKKLGSDFKGRHYHLLNKNCNHFSSELSRVLCGKKLPGWINRTARFARYIPFMICVPTAGESAEYERRHPSRVKMVPAVNNVATQTGAEHHHHHRTTITTSEGPKPAGAGWLTGFEALDS